MKPNSLVLLALITLVGWLACPRAEAAEPGADVVDVFSRAARGEPLRYVAIGGSITQASGPGWVGDWLREQFPKSDVTVVNSGMSGTGSSLGIFRAERDIISHEPDLVAIEYCVNDGGLTDDQAIRYMETLVVRLKSLPHPPAIVIVEAAARTGVNLERHRRVARHYDLIEVDLQAAVNARLAAIGKPWGVLFADDVHPNRAGHAFYAETMREVLRPLVERARAADTTVPTSAASLPAPLSAKPLLLDARMTPLHGHVTPGWKALPLSPVWWSRFFQGALTAEEPGTMLRIPVRGTTVGLIHSMGKDQGSFFVNVDGGTPRHIFVNTRDGFSSTNVGVDLPAREHVLNVVLPAKSETDPRRNGPVTLGYVLLAGETHATREPSPQGKFTAEVMRALNFVAVSANAWSWAGPFATPASDGRPPVDARADTFSKFMTEPGDADFDLGRFVGKSIASEGDLVNFRTLIGNDAPAFAYARAQIDGGAGGEALVSITVDYYCQLWLNGERILVFDGPHPRPHFLSVQLKPGANDLFIKAGAGSAGHSFQLSVARL